MMRPHLFMLSMLSFGLLCLSACYRSDVRTWEVEIPQARSVEERTAIAGVLLQKNEMMLEGVTMFYDIEVTDTGLRITYHALLTAKQNMAHFIADMGYAAGDVPGDPDLREAFRRQHLSTAPAPNP